MGPARHGQDSLARLLAEAVGADFRTVSAVMSGAAEVRATIAEAQETLALSGRRSVLFIDEIHRLQQGAAGRAPAARRGRHGHAHRRDDREPIIGHRFRHESGW
ncbi:MAG: AAA family ATPase [Chloroflexota bacterium]